LKATSHKASPIAHKRTIRVGLDLINPLTCNRMNICV
jgi:hypothetical protein